MSSRLGEILVKESLIAADQLKQALEYQQKNGGRLGTCLMKLGLVTDDEITEVLSRQYGVPSINLKYLRSRSDGDQADSAGYGGALPDCAAVARRFDADHCDDRSDERLRHGRYQVHDRLQRRTGGGVGIGDQRGHLQVLRRRRERRRTQQGDEGPHAARRRDLELAAEEQEMDLADARKGRRGSADHQAGEPDPDRRGEAGSERHSRRAVRKRVPRAVPH